MMTRRPAPAPDPIMARHRPLSHGQACACRMVALDPEMPASAREACREALVLAAWPLARKLIRRAGPDLDDDDRADAAMLALARAIGYWDPARGAWGTAVGWQARAAVNEVRSAAALNRRRTGREPVAVGLWSDRPGDLSLEEVAHAPALADAAALADDLARAEAALARLPARWRDAFVAVHTGAPLQPLAARMGVSRTRVGQLARQAGRALAVARRRLQPAS